MFISAGCLCPGSCDTVESAENGIMWHPRDQTRTVEICMVNKHLMT